MHTYATAHSSRALVLLEHECGVTEPSSLSALMAVQRHGVSLTGLVVRRSRSSANCPQRAKKYIHVEMLLRVRT